jgi:hypothetical protein
MNLYGLDQQEFVGKEAGYTLPSITAMEKMEKKRRKNILAASCQCQRRERESESWACPRRQ